jgi:hypothetical protein
MEVRLKQLRYSNHMLPGSSTCRVEKDLLRLNETQEATTKAQAQRPRGRKTLPPTPAAATADEEETRPPLTYSGFVHRIKMYWLMYAAARHGNIDLFHATLLLFCPYYDDFNNMVVMDEALDTINIYCSQILKTSPETSGW